MSSLTTPSLSSWPRQEKISAEEGMCSLVYGLLYLRFYDFTTNISSR